jgi:C-terminal processing protease CtpA/Prc
MKRKSVFLLILLALFTANIHAQSIYNLKETKGSTSSAVNRQRGLEMLDQIKDVLKDRYYDSNYRGINLNERFKKAAENIKKLDTNWQIFNEIAQILLEFNDSHTRFIPPGRQNKVEYGFTMQAIGDDCFVTEVKKGSDAETQGLKAGDQILFIGKYPVDRDILWQIKYYIYQLDPQYALELTIKDIKGEQRKVLVKSKVVTLEERLKEAKERKSKQNFEPYKCQKINSELIACKLYSFSVEKGVVDKMMKEVGDHKKFILDLRGNGGGYVKTDMHLIGYFFDRDIKVATMKTRHETKEWIAKSHKNKGYRGELTVLIDSESASAAEVFARTIQIEKRGNVVGDRSSGAVMTSNFMSLAAVRGGEGFQTYSFFGLNVTIGDMIMSDGNRLEVVGVLPDFPVGPTNYALSIKSDPILSYAAMKHGVKITEEQAGTYYFLAQKPEEKDDEEKETESEN